MPSCVMQSDDVGETEALTELQETASETIDWAARRKERAQEREASKLYKRWWFIALVAVATVLVSAVGAEAALSYGRVHPGVTVAGVDVGGKAPSEARALLEVELPQKASEPIEVIHEDQTWTYNPAELGVDFDYSASIDDAMAVGRSGGARTAVTGRVGAWLGGVEVPPYLVADDALVKKALDDISARTDVAPVDAGVKMNGVKASVVPGSDGMALDRERASAEMLESFLSDDRRVEAPVVVDEVEITDAEAASVARLAEQMVAEPVKVTYEGKAWTFTPEQVASWLAFKRSDEASAAGTSVIAASDDESGSVDGGITLVVHVDAELVGKTAIPKIGADIGREAKNAKFTTANGKVTIVPSQDGIGPDVDSLAISLTDKLANEGDREVELRTTRTEPEITTEKARSMGIKERISTYTTTFDAGNGPRVKNIHLLGDSLDGKLVPPGETFSFNGTIGERTAAKGYKEANAIVNGKLVPSLGGGICQVATTLFNTIYESGMPVIERRNHSFYISSYPKGRDAAVSWGGPDLKFKNDTAQWMLISVSYTSSSVTVSLYGTDPGYQISSSASDFRPGAAFPVEETKDSSLPAGTRVIEAAGVNGRSVTVTRTIKKDGKVVRTDNFVSNYTPKTQIVRVGTKVAASTTTTGTPTR